MSTLHDRLRDLAADAPHDGFGENALMRTAHTRLRRHRLRVAGAAGLAAAVVAVGLIAGPLPRGGHDDVEPAGGVVQMTISSGEIAAAEAPALTPRDVTVVYRSPVIPGARFRQGFSTMLPDGRALLNRHNGSQWGYVDAAGGVHWWAPLPAGGRADSYAGTLPDGRIVVGDGAAHTSDGQGMLRFWVLQGGRFTVVRVPLDGHGRAGIYADMDLVVGGDRLWLAEDGDGGETIWSHPFSASGSWTASRVAAPLAVSADHELEMSLDQTVARLRDLGTGDVTTFRPPAGCLVNSGAVGEVVAIGLDCDGRGHVLIYSLEGEPLLGVRMSVGRLETSGSMVAVLGNGSPNALIDVARRTVERTSRISDHVRAAAGDLIAWSRQTGPNSVRWYVGRVDRH